MKIVEQRKREIRRIFEEVEERIVKANCGISSFYIILNIRVIVKIHCL